VTAQEFLGEGLRAFQLRGRLVRPEAAQTGGFESIDNAEHEGRFGPDDRQSDVLAPREIHERCDILRGHCDITQLGFARRTRIARRHQHFSDAG